MKHLSRLVLTTAIMLTICGCASGPSKEQLAAQQASRKEQLAEQQASREKQTAAQQLAYKNKDFLEAAERGDLPAVESLIAKGTDVNAQYNGVTALMAASLHGHTQVVRVLLDNGADVNGKTANQATALIAASLYGHKEIVELLLAKGADVNVKGGKNSETALIAASRQGGKEIVQLLLAKGADVNAGSIGPYVDSKATDGFSALMFASQEGHKEVVQLLLAKGADVNAKATTTIMRHSQEGHKEVNNMPDLYANLPESVKEGNFVNQVFVKGQGQGMVIKDVTALMLASLHSHKEVVRLLLAKRADVNANTTDGQTALSLASQDEIRKLLIKAGAK